MSDTLEILQPDEAVWVWKNLQPRVIAALSRNGSMSRMLYEQIRMSVSTGEARVLLRGDSLGIVYLDPERVLHLLVYSGTLTELRQLAPEFYAYAKSVGAEKIRITGPRAWLRVHPDLKEKLVVMEVELKEEQHGSAQPKPALPDRDRQPGQGDRERPDGRQL